MRWVLTIALFVVAVAVTSRGQDFEPVAKVIDGDTFIMASGEHVRLIGVNAPERGRCYAREASEQVQIATAHGVRLARHGKDKYGRTLAYAFADWTKPLPSLRLYTNSINIYLILNGYAKADRRNANSYRLSYLKGEKKAKQIKAGLWNPLTCPVYPF